MNSSILRFVEDGVEYFTVVDTGESGMSQSGLARACGKDEKQIRRLVADLRTNKAPKRLKRFIDKELTLTTEAFKRGGKLIIYKSSFCAAVIKHYAYLGSEEAQEVDEAIGDIGAASFIQSKTGWLPSQYTAAPEAHQKLNRIMSKPRPFHPLFGDENVQMVADMLRCSRNSPKIANWFWGYIYCTLTPEEVCKLNRENPVMPNGHRKYAIHQWMEENATIEHKKYFDKVLSLLEISESEDQFVEFWFRKYHKIYQLSLDFSKIA